MISVRAEVSSLRRLETESARLYRVLQTSVDTEIQEAGFLPDATKYGMLVDGKAGQNGAASNGARTPTVPVPATDASRSSEKQKTLIAKVAKEQKFTAEDLDGIAQRLFKLPLAATRPEANQRLHHRTAGDRRASALPQGFGAPCRHSQRRGSLSHGKSSERAPLARGCALTRHNSTAMSCFEHSEELPPRLAKLNRLIQSRRTEALGGGPQAGTGQQQPCRPRSLPSDPDAAWPNPRAMTDAEVLAAVLHLPEGAAPRANELLTRYGSLSALSRCTVQEIAAFPTIGERRAMQLVAAFTLGPRMARERYTRQKLDSPELVYDLMALRHAAASQGIAARDLAGHSLPSSLGRGGVPGQRK